ncbi:MAG: NADH-quinone oxidoreductase subunit F [Thermoplasmata archaeon]|nr:NADH-quinone oxidoreductase subunit F [Thermoplasmata archaeon]
MVMHPVLLIAIPLLVAFIIPLFKKYGPSIALGALALNTGISIALFSVVYSTGTVHEIIAGFAPPIGIFLAVDSLSALLAMIINLFALINFMAIGKASEYKFSMLYLLAVAGSTGIVITGDIFNMFVFFEITAVASYALVASRKDKKSMEGAIKYMILGSLGSIFILIGIALIYSQLKSLNIYDIASRISTMDAKIKWASVAMLLTGIGVEAEIFPLNGWVPDAYQGASGGVASLLSFGPSKAAIYAIARIMLVIFPLQKVYYLVLTIGVITLLIGELAALKQENVKRMLAYSSIGQMGLITIAIAMGMNEKNAILAIFFLMVSHASSKASLFLLSDSSGMGSAATKYTGIVSVLGIVGMPPFAGFWGKWYLLMAAINGNMLWVIVLIFFSGIVEAAYFARYLHRYYGNEESFSRLTKYSMAVLATMSLIFGLLPLIYEMGLKTLFGMGGV